VCRGAVCQGAVWLRCVVCVLCGWVGGCCVAEVGKCVRALCG